MANVKILWGVIIILVLIVIGMFGSSYYKSNIAEKQQEAYEMGYGVGIEDSVVSIIQQSRNCNAVSLIIQNQTFQFIDVVCLQAQE